jgi:hypothetical protein
VQALLAPAPEIATTPAAASAEDGAEGADGDDEGDGGDGDDDTVLSVEPAA